MKFFFLSPKSRIYVSKPLAVCLNTLNMLGPVLLLCALLLLLFAYTGNHLAEIQTSIVKTATALLVAALVIRVIWGVAVRLVATKRSKSE